MLTNDEVAGLLITIGGQARRIRALEQEVGRLRAELKKAEAPATADNADVDSVVADADDVSAIGNDAGK